MIYSLVECSLKGDFKEITQLENFQLSHQEFSK